MVMEKFLIKDYSSIICYIAIPSINAEHWLAQNFVPVATKSFSLVESQTSLTESKIHISTSLHQD